MKKSKKSNSNTPKKSLNKNTSKKSFDENIKEKSYNENTSKKSFDENIKEKSYNENIKENYRPTYGFNAKAFSYNNLNITIYDCGGKSIFRNLWEYYYQNTDGIIFVIDSSDPEKFEESGKELIHMLNNPILENKPLLVFANKGDKCNSVSVKEMSEYFGLRDINNREWVIIKCSSESGIGVYEGFFWLINCCSKSN